MRQLEIWQCQEQVADAPLIFPNPIKAEKLKEIADKMADTVSAKKNPAIAQKPPTRRRARIAASIIDEGKRLEQIQLALFSLSQAHQQGNLPRILKGISEKTQVEELISLRNYSYQQIEELFADGNSISVWRLRKAFIFTAKQCQKAIEAFNKLCPPQVEDESAAELSYLKIEAILNQIPDFFPTPEFLIKQLIELADVEPGMKILEPSAGSGDICLQLRALGVEPDCFEVNYDLQKILQLQGFNLIGADFLEANSEPIYDRIIGNPPFSKGEDIIHIQQMFKWLKPGGRLVSIASNSYTFNRQRKYKEFREWLRQFAATEIENPHDAFSRSQRPTAIRTMTIVIDKP